MTRLTFFFGPGTCSRAVHIALEEIGVDYDPRVVTYMQGEHRTEEFLAMNPNGKTPLLLVDGEPLHETPAILLYLNAAYPEAKIMPKRSSIVGTVKDVADLVWCASELHPNVFRIRIPQYFCDRSPGRERSRDIAVEDMHAKFAIIERRLSKTPWFLGESWSAVDGYLMWVWFRLQGTAFDASPYTFFADHYARMQQRPAVQRAGAMEAEAGQRLAAEGNKVDFETFRRGKTPADFIAQRRPPPVN